MLNIGLFLFIFISSTYKSVLVKSLNWSKSSKLIKNRIHQDITLRM